MRAARLAAFIAVGALPAISACELQEVTLAEPADVVVAEVYLHAGEPVQRAFLHRTIGTVAAGDVPGARIEVRDEYGRTMIYAERSVDACFEVAAPGTIPTGSCYTAGERTFSPFVLPGRTYTLRIELADGGVLEGKTTVPTEFRLIQPAVDPVQSANVCTLQPGRRTELVWTRAEGTWIYLAEAEIAGLRSALADRGITIEDDPYRLVGLSVTEADSTIVFPTEFGVFDRFDDDGVLLAIRDGLPPGVWVRGAITAADRNYVNWARGGNFNPSGSVRVPSIHGAGTGVFGSLLTGAFFLDGRAGPNSTHPPCPVL